MNPLDYKYLADTIPFVQNGKTLLSIGFHITFYFGDGNTQKNRQAIVKIFNEYAQLCGDQLKWQTHPVTFNWQKITKKHSPEYWVLENPKNTVVWQLCFHGGRTFDESSPYRIEAVGYPNPDRRLSFFHVGFPATWFSDPEKEDPVTLVTRWANILKPWHGTAGFSIMPALDTQKESEVSPHSFALARRFPGLEYNEPISHAMYLNNTIKSVNWLTIIQTDLVAKLGGLASLEQELSTNTDIFIHPYDGGVVIQAGQYPEIGDVNHQLIPEHYRDVNKVLKPIRVGDQHRSFLGFTEEATQEWLARFD